VHKETALQNALRYNFAMLRSARFSDFEDEKNSLPAHAFSSGGSRKKYLGAWPLIIWDATTAKRNYYRTN